MTLLKKLIWIGPSRENLKEMPEERSKDEIGYVSLHQAQAGLFPDHAKPLKGFSGVIEIISDFDKNTYRAVFCYKIRKLKFMYYMCFKRSQKQAKKHQKKKLK